MRVWYTQHVVNRFRLTRRQPYSFEIMIAIDQAFAGSIDKRVVDSGYAIKFDIPSADRSIQMGTYEQGKWI